MLMHVQGYHTEIRGPPSGLVLPPLGIELGASGLGRTILPPSFKITLRSLWPWMLGEASLSENDLQNCTLSTPL